MNNVALMQSLSMAGKYAGYGKFPCSPFTLPEDSDNYDSETAKEMRYQLYLKNREKALEEAAARERRLQRAKQKAHEECEEELKRLRKIGESIQQEYKDALFEKIRISGGGLPYEYTLLEKEKLYQFTEVEEFVKYAKEALIKQFDFWWKKDYIIMNTIEYPIGNVIFDLFDKSHKRKNLSEYRYQYMNGKHIITEKHPDDKNTILDFKEKKFIVVDFMFLMGMQEDKMIRIISYKGEELFLGTLYQLAWVHDTDEPHIHPLAKKRVIEVKWIDNIFTLVISELD